MKFLGRAEDLKACRTPQEMMRFYTSNCRHDVLSPLRAIMGFAGILQSDFSEGMDESGQQFLACLIDAAERQEKMLRAQYAALEAIAERLPATLDDSLIDELHTEIAKGLASHQRHMNERAEKLLSEEAQESA